MRGREKNSLKHLNKVTAGKTVAKRIATKKTMWKNVMKKIVIELS